MVLRYVSAKSPESLSAYVGRLSGIRIAVISGPLFAKGRWYLWLTADRGILKNNVDLED